MIIPLLINKLIILSPMMSSDVQSAVRNHNIFTSKKLQSADSFFLKSFLQLINQLPKLLVTTNKLINNCSSMCQCRMIT